MFDLPAVPQWFYQRAGDRNMNEPTVFVDDEFVSGGGEEQREQRGQIGERRAVIRANVGGASYQVAGLLRATNVRRCVVFGTSSPGRHKYAAAVNLPGGVEAKHQSGAHGLRTAPAATGELERLEVAGEKRPGQSTFPPRRASVYQRAPSPAHRGGTLGSGAALR